MLASNGASSWECHHCTRNLVPVYGIIGPKYGLTVLYRRATSVPNYACVTGNVKVPANPPTHHKLVARGEAVWKTGRNQGRPICWEVISSPKRYLEICFQTRIHCFTTKHIKRNPSVHHYSHPSEENTAEKRDVTQVGQEEARWDENDFG